MKNGARLWAVVAILALAFGLRLCRLGAQSLWYDETVSAYLASQPARDLVAHTAGDIHPPGYYLLLHGWICLAGESEFAAALLSVCFGVVLAALAYRLGTRVFGSSAGLTAALLVAVSPYNLWYSQEVRMYTLAAATGMGVLWCVLILIDSPRRGLPAWLALAGYALLASFGLWVLYYFAFLLVAVNLLIVVWWLVSQRSCRVGWGWMGRWLAAQGLTVVLYAPWLPIAWRQATSPPVPPWRSLTPLGDLVTSSWSALSLGQSVEPTKVWPVLLLTAFLFSLGAVPARLPRRPGQKWRTMSWLLGGYVLVPVLLIWLASFLSPLYHVRYVFTYSTPFYVIVGAGLAWLQRRWKRAAWSALAVLLGFSAASMQAYHTDYDYAADDHRSAVRFVAENWRPGDAVLVDAGYVYTALETYWQGEPVAWRGRLVGTEGLDYGELAHTAPVVLLAGTVNGDDRLGWGDPESDFYAMDVAEVDTALSQVFADFNRVWVYRCYDTVTDPNGDIRRWLGEHGALFEDQVFTGESQLRVQGYLTGRDPLADTVPVEEALADGTLSLSALGAPTLRAEVGGHLDVTPVWRVESEVKDGRILFAGLFGEDGRRWGQTDARPLGSLYPIEAWAPGAVVRTPLRIPVLPGTPTGRYRLEIGWYRFVDALPVWVPWHSGNLFLVGEVEVIAPDDWWGLPAPEVQETSGVTLGDGLRLEGVNNETWQASRGDAVQLELVWRGLGPTVAPASTVLLLGDDSGRIVVETSGDSGETAQTLAGLKAGQAIRAVEVLSIAPSVPAGVYSLAVGRRRSDGTWLPVRRGVFFLGSTVPLGTIRVVEPTSKAADLSLPTHEPIASATE